MFYGSRRHRHKWSNGKVGDVAWQTGPKNGVEPGWVRTDLNISIPT